MTQRLESSAVLPATVVSKVSSGALTAAARSATDEGHSQQPRQVAPEQPYITMEPFNPHGGTKSRPSTTNISLGRLNE